LTVVLDANLLVVLALNDGRAPLVETKLREWATAGEKLHAPALMPYEAANALLRAAVAVGLAPDVVAELWATIAAVPVTLHQLVEGAAVIAIAQRLGRQSLRRGVRRARTIPECAAVDARRAAGTQRTRPWPAGTAARIRRRLIHVCRVGARLAPASMRASSPSGRRSCGSSA
jgi:predicted nucleic acid-binding protein